MNNILKFWSFVFGLLPFNRGNANFNIVDYAPMIIVPCCYLICFAIVNSDSHIGIYQANNCDSICRTGNKLFMNMGCFLYVSIAGLSIWRGKGFYRDFDEKLTDLDILIGQIYRRVSKMAEEKRTNYLYHLTWAVAVAAFILNVGYDGYKMYMYFDLKFYIPLMITTFPYVAGSLVQAQFIYYVTVATNRFSKLNAIFDRINSECEIKNAPLEVFDIDSHVKENEKEKKLREKAKKEKKRVKKDRKKRKKHRRQSSSEENSSRDSSPSSVSSEESGNGGNYSEASTAEKGVISNTDGPTSEAVLPELFRLHDKILELSVLTNGEYGAQAVPYMAACFVISIFGIFLETKVSFIVGGRNPILDYVNQMYLMWSITTMFIAYLVLRMCCSASSNSKQSVMIIHEIMQKKPAFMLGNDFYYNKMKSFTLQFLHWEGYFQFNGIGLFALDYTFIFSTVSAATSYLIVLLQFDMSTILRNEGLI